MTPHIAPPPLHTPISHLSPGKAITYYKVCPPDVQSETDVVARVEGSYRRTLALSLVGGDGTPPHPVFLGEALVDLKASRVGGRREA